MIQISVFYTDGSIVSWLETDSISLTVEHASELLASDSGIVRVKVTKF